MHIETPQMAVRRLTGLSSTYMDAIYTSFITMRGSGASLQEDFSTGLGVLTTYERTAKATLTGDATADIAITKTWAAIGASNDFLIAAVGKVAAASSASFTIGGAAINQRIAIHCQQGDSVLSIYDGTGYTLSSTAADPSVGDLILMVGVRDDDVDLYAYGYNLTTSAVIWDVDGGGETGVGAITPAVNSMGCDDWQELYGGILFNFGDGGLPTTWKADMLAMAQTLVEAKS